MHQLGSQRELLGVSIGEGLGAGLGLLLGAIVGDAVGAALGEGAVTLLGMSLGALDDRLGTLETEDSMLAAKKR